MAMNNPKLYEAFEEEAKEIDVQELMAQMMESYNKEKGYEPTPMDYLRIRKMMLARKYLQKEADHMTLLRDAIVEEWNQRIKKKLDEIKNIEEFIENWLKKYNDGKKLSLDVGTATLRRSAPRVKVIDEEKAKEYLKEHGQLEAFTKPAPLDKTLLQNAYVNKFKEIVAKQAEDRIAEEKEKEGKITKKREKEIYLEVEQELADDYFNSLPDFFEYIPEKHSISIIMK